MHPEQNHEKPLTRLGRFEILAPIGSGGMASIYLARIAGPAGFEKPVALKVIHSHLAEDPEFVQMFFDEARIASQLHHPNIVQILELGQSSGTYFIAMEYLRGETLGAIVQKLVQSGGELIDLRMACHIAMGACEGLHYAHEMTDIDGRDLGLVHRDVSPQNLFVTYSGSVKLMDFGIARAAGLAHTTRPGSLKGKFSYMSPEQARGQSLDLRSDVFALGIVFWEMLAGRRLFKGKSDIESLQRVSQARVPRLTSFRSDIPPTLDTVVLRALAREVEDRYQNAIDLHGDLTVVAEQLGTSVTTHELARQMGQWFPEEEKRKKSLLSRALPVMQMPAIRAGDMVPPTIIEETPSVTSGVHLRESGISDSTTPSNSNIGWPTSAPEAMTSHLVPAVSPGPLGSQEGSLSYSVDWAPKPLRTARKVAVAVAIVVVLVLIGFGAYLLIFGQRRAGGGDTSQGSVDPQGSAGAAVLEAGAAPDAGAPPTEGPDLIRPPATSSEPQPEETDTVTVSFKLHPSSAEIAVAGVPQKNPSEVRLKQSSQAVEVVVTAQGFAPATFSITPSRDQDKRVVLKRRRRAPPKKQKQRENLLNNPYYNKR